MSTTTEDCEKRYESIIAITKKLAEDARNGEHQKIDQDFSFQTTSTPITLSEAFGEKSDLIIIHNMGTICSWCTMWADGFNGMIDHLADRSAFLLLSPDIPETVEEFAQDRGWTFPVASARDSGFNEYIAFGESDDAYPGFSTLHKDTDGTIWRIATECFGDFDLFSPVWHMIARLKDGVADWQPKFSYEDTSE